jgi:ABC-type glycerol-3-phosphate transport system substrate-binding protein
MSMKRVLVTLLIMLACTLPPHTHAQRVQLKGWVTLFNNQAAMEIWSNVIYPDFQRAYPNIEVAMEPPTSDFQAYREKILVAYAGGVGPDVFEIGAQGEVTKYVENGMALDLERYLSKWPDEASFIPVTWDVSRYRGRRWSVPWHVDPRGVIARTDILAEVGLDPSNVTTDWRAFLDAVKRLTVLDSEGRLLRRGLNPSNKGKNTFEEWLLLLGQNGKYLINDSGNPDFLNDAGLESLQYYCQLVEASQPGVDYSGPSPGINRLFSGQLAMEFRVGIGRYSSALKVGQEIADSLLPLLPLKGPVSRTATLYINQMAISSASRYPDEAFALISFIMQPKYSIPVAIATGRFSPLKAQALVKDVRENPFMSAMAAMMEYGLRDLKTPQYFDIRAAVFPALEKALQGQVAPGYALEEADRVVYALLKESAM